MAEEPGHVPHLIVLLAQLLELAVLLALLGGHAQELVLGVVVGRGVVVIDVHLARLPELALGDLLLGLAQREPRDLVAVGHLVVLVLRRLVMPGVGRLGLRDLHGRGALLLCQVQVRLVPLQTLAAGDLVVCRLRRGAGQAATGGTRGSAGGTRRSTMAGICLGIDDGELLLRQVFFLNRRLWRRLVI